MLPDVLDHVADGVVLADADDRVRYLNPAAERLAGRSLGRAVDRSLEELCPDLPELLQIVRRAREVGSPVGRDGLRIGSVPVDAIAAPLHGGTRGEHGPSAPAPVEAEGWVVLTLRDRSVARTLEADARQAERLASFATVAAGIAHEVKNPLGGIRGAAQLMGRMAGDSESASPRSAAAIREYVDVIVREVDRIAAMVDRLRDLSSAERSGPVARTDLNRLLHELVTLQGSTGEADIALDLDPSLPAVDGDADELRRLFLNLLRNALEAPARRVTVATRVETGRKWRAPAGSVHALVSVTVTDDGPGIPPEHHARLFEPFFTTKPRGSGLGLAAVQRITRMHEGTVVVEDAADGGTRVAVTFPAARHESAGAVSGSAG